jgi:hypothetical protein
MCVQSKITKSSPGWGGVRDLSPMECLLVR